MIQVVHDKTLENFVTKVPVVHSLCLIIVNISVFLTTAIAGYYFRVQFSRISPSARLSFKFSLTTFSILIDTSLG